MQERAYLTQALGKVGMVSRQNPIPQSLPAIVEGNNVFAGNFVFAGTNSNQVKGTATAGTTPEGVAIFNGLQVSLTAGNTLKINEGETIQKLISGCCYIPNNGLAPNYLDYVLVDPTTGKVNCSASSSQVATAGKLYLPFASETYTDYTGITAGTLKLIVDGTAKDLTGLDFSSATSMSNVAGVITTALSSSATCAYTSGEGLTITSATTGATSNVSFVEASADLLALLGQGTSIDGTNAMIDTGWKVLTINNDLQAIEIIKK